MELARSVASFPVSELDSALIDYDVRRRGPMRTRTALGPALLDVFTGNEPDMRMLRQGLFNYWRSSSRARERSLALLATHETRSSRMLMEYASVFLHGLLGWKGAGMPRGEIPLALRNLAHRSLAYVRTVPSS